MSKAEAEIGARVKEFRERIEWPQSVFAHEVGITRNKLASIEYGFTPLRCDVALRICKRYKVSELWLAKGVGSPQPYLSLAEKSSALSPKMLFSRAFSAYLEPNIPKELRHLLMYPETTGATSVIIPPMEVPVHHRHESFVLKSFRALLASVPNEDRTAICDEVLRAIKSIYDRRQEPQRTVPFHASMVAIKQSQKRYGAAAQKNDLPDTETAARYIAMQMQLPGLLERLKKATQGPGKKTELAKFLSKQLSAKVPLASISRWLSGEREPGGEVALQMDAWATKQGFPRAS